MKNTWKGLMFGAFTGAAIGVVLDALEAVQAKAGEAGARLKVRAHDAADSLDEATHRAGDWVKDKDVPGMLHSKVADLSSSAPVERIRDAIERD